MKTENLENGDLILSQDSKPIFVIFGLIIFLFFAKDAFIWVFTSGEVSGNRFLAIIVIVLAVLFFYRMFSLGSKFKFSRIEKRLIYSIQYPFSNKKGVISILCIEKAVVEIDNDSCSRVVINCRKKEIPMTSTVKSLGGHEFIVDEINDWLKENKNS